MEFNLPVVSVIVPVYNSNPYLRKCLDSILYQSFEDFELICVDDGSKDGSERMLYEYQDRDDRVVVITRDECSGSAAVPRNIGLDIAKGEYVCILDSDDWFDTTMLEKMYQKAKETDADLVMCDNYRVAPDGTMRTDGTELCTQYLPSEKVFSWEDITPTIFQISHATAWHKLIKKSLIEKNKLRFQEGVPILDDIYFVNMALVLAKSITIVPERLVYYREGREESQTNKIKKHKDSIYRSFRRLNDELIDRNIYDCVKVSLQNWTLQTMFWWLHSVDDYRVFAELCDLYKNSYFEDLNLNGIDPRIIREESYRRMYQSIISRNSDHTIYSILDTRRNKELRVVLYGAGKYGRIIRNEIRNCNKLILESWIDKTVESSGGEQVCKPQEIKKHKFDAVLIAISDCVVAKEVFKELGEYGVEADKCYMM